MIEWLNRNRKFSIIFLLLIAIEIFVISSIPGGGISAGPNLAWLYHFSVFFVFNFLLLVSIVGRGRITGKKLAFVIIISIAYAILDEIHQYFVPGRNPALADVFVDSIGIFSSSLVYLCCCIKKK